MDLFRKYKHFFQYLRLTVIKQGGGKEGKKKLTKLKLIGVSDSLVSLLKEFRGSSLAFVWSHHFA